MVNTTASTISGTPPCRTMERLANAALSPGHVVELMSTDKFRKNTRAALPGTPKIIALEKEYLGKGITTAYAAADQVVAGVFKPGSMVTLRLAASAVAVVIGDLLECAADGTVRKVTGTGSGYLTDNSGGTANTTIQDMGATYTEAEGANNFADVAAAINRLGAFALALEAVDNSAGGAEVFIRCQLV